MNAKIYQLKKQLIKLNKEMNEKLEKFNMERQSIMDEIEKLKTQPVFTLSGFLNGEFAVSFASDFERGIFMGWLQITTDTVWGSKRRPVQYKPQKYVIMLEETLQTGTAVDRLRVPVIQFDTSWFSDTAPFL